MDYTILVNKKKLLKKDYIPNDLIEIENKSKNHLDPNYKTMLDRFVYEQFKKMASAALKEGYRIVVDSGYRSYDYQQQLLDYNFKKNGEMAYLLVAPPGGSEHQTGIAFDASIYRGDEFIDDIKGDEPEIIWMHNNCEKYGFILRYPSGKEKITGYNYEPWHFRYVGVELAKYLKNNNLTLEEYYGK